MMTLPNLASRGFLPANTAPVCHHALLMMHGFEASAIGVLEVCVKTPKHLIGRLVNLLLILLMLLRRLISATKLR